MLFPIFIFVFVLFFSCLVLFGVLFFRKKQNISLLKVFLYLKNIKSRR